MSSQSPVSWHDEFLGVAYRYYDLRMNVVPLFDNQTVAKNLWYDTIHWWVDPSIKIRFVDVGDKYWFIMGAESQKPHSNLFFFKVLEKSENYERFKKGNDGEAYLRLGIYSKKYLNEVKKDAVCDCGHVAEDHDEGDGDVCLYESCDCKAFVSFQVTLLKRKKTITDIEYLKEEDVKNDPLVWNCLYVNKYSKDE